MVVTSAAFAEAHGLDVMARITDYTAGGTEPKDLFFAPIVAVENLLMQSGSKIDSYDLIEANEAFAVQAVADGNALGWDWDKVNVHGGAIALGHPIGASGARVLTTRFMGNAAYIDLATGDITSIWNVRAACMNNLFPADGILNIPNLSGGCTCNYMPISQAFAPVLAFE